MRSKLLLNMTLCSVLSVGAAQAGAIIASLSPAANTLAANDDGSAPSTGIGFTANFFGTNYFNLFPNNNGNVTFNNPLVTFTPFNLTGATNIPIIAPFFADIDTRGTGSGLLTYGATTYTTNDSVLRNVFVANWINVGYFPSASDKLNSIQLLLIERADTGAGNFDIMFNYDGILWETGSASGGSNGFGGSSARVGYSAGSGAAGTFNQFTGSGVNGALINGGPNALISSTNVLASDLQYTSTNGRYVLNVRNGAVVSDVPEASTWTTALAGLGLAVLRARKRF